MNDELLLCAGLHIELCVELLIFVRVSGGIELLWISFRRAPSRARTRFRRQRGALERVQPLFLIERDGKQDGFHGVIARLICGRLRVGAHAAKQAVKIFLILAAQRAAEFRPPRDGVVDQLPECRNCAAHKIRDS